MATPLAGDTPLVATRTRPNVLAMPSSTVSRFVLLVAALLSSGLFVGTWVHNETAVFEDWLARVRECEALRPPVAPGASASEVLLAEQVVLRCVEGAQQRLAWFAVGGVVLTVLAACVVLAAVPTVVIRRRRLRPAGPQLTAASERLTALAGECGLRRAPETMVGPAKLRDAFSLGLPGRYRVALPPALAVRSTGRAFEPMVRHELAHVKRHDVTIAWSARALWYVAGVLLLLPVVLALVQADLSLLPSYLWRAALLLAATVLASAGILRSREYDADLGSATTSARREALSAVLGTSGRAPATGWRRLLARHPAASHRLSVLADPGPLARPSAVDGAVAGFLAGVTVPMLVALMATVPSATRWAYVVPAVLVGPMLGATVGLALGRPAVVDVVTRTRMLPRSSRVVAAALAAGYLVGQAASLAAVGSESVTGSTTPLPPLLGALALAGTTFVVAGLAALAADRSAHLSVRGYTTATITVSATLFAFVLWAATTLTSALDLGGWSLATRVAATLLSRPPAVALVVALAVTVLLLMTRREAHPPTWAVEGEPVAAAASSGPSARAWQALLVALVAGTVGASTILAFRLAAGAAQGEGEQLQRLDVYTYVFAGVGAAAGLTLLVLHGMRGTGLGLLAAVAGSATAALGFVVVNTAFGGAPTPHFVLEVVGRGLPVGVLLFVLGSLVYLVVPEPAGRRPVWLLVGVATLLTFVAAVAPIAARDAISPLPETAASGAAVQEYVVDYAASVTARLSDVDRATSAIDADVGLTGPERAQRIRDELVSPVDQLLVEAAAVTPADEGLARAHAVLVEGLEGTRAAFEGFARAYETDDPGLFQQAQADRAAAQQLVGAWLEEVGARLAE